MAKLGRVNEFVFVITAQNGFINLYLKIGMTLTATFYSKNSVNFAPHSNLVSPVNCCR